MPTLSNFTQHVAPHQTDTGLKTALGSRCFKALSFVGLLSLLTFTQAGCERTSQANITQWPSDQNCNLHAENCVVQQGDATVSLKIRPHPIPIARPLGIEVTLENLSAEKIELDISGVNMYMGYNRVQLTPADQSGNQPGRYVGTSMLAFCTNETMQWQITLMIHQADGSQIQIPYPLETRNR